jgi:hypothetical protein
MKIEELLDEVDSDYEVVLSMYACGNTFKVKLSELRIQEIDAVNKQIVFDAEFN